MSFLFGSNKPDPAPVPVSPLASEEAQRQRQAAQDAALAQQRGAGRAQTVAAGNDIASDEQMVKGQRSAGRRASRDIMG